MENEIAYKFNLGDTVTHVSAAQWEVDEQKKQDEEHHFWRPDRASEQRWFIVERQSQECPGGIQRHYTCRGVSRSGGVTKEFFRFNEIELSPIVNKKK